MRHKQQMVMVGEKCILFNKVCSYAVVLQLKCHRKNAIYGFVINLTCLQCHVKEKHSEQILDAWFSAGQKIKYENVKCFNSKENGLFFCWLDNNGASWGMVYIKMEWNTHWYTDVLMQFMKSFGMTLKLQSNVQWGHTKSEVKFC